MGDFNLGDCAIPTVWCGKKGNPPKRKPTDETYYYKTGNRYECMQKGFGAGLHTERRENLPNDSLQRIKYVGEKYEEKFHATGMTDLNTFRIEMSQKSPQEIEKYLKKIFKRKGGSLDQRAYNSTLVFLYRNGVGNIPACSKIQV